MSVSQPRGPKNDPKTGIAQYLNPSRRIETSSDPKRDTESSSLIWARAVCLIKKAVAVRKHLEKNRKVTIGSGRLWSHQNGLKDG
jgi:ribosomal protein S15P/S13E